jgi:hypothetical protein
MVRKESILDKSIKAPHGIELLSNNSGQIIWNDQIPGIEPQFQAEPDTCDITTDTMQSNCDSASVTLDPANLPWADDSEYPADYIAQLTTWLADPILNQSLTTPPVNDQQ